VAKKKKTSKKKPPPAKSIGVRWGDSEELPTLYANHLFISHTGPQFYLVFGELGPHSEFMDIGPEELPPYVEIEPVAKIAVAHEVMLSIRDTIDNNVKRFIEGQKDKD